MPSVFGNNVLAEFQTGQTRSIRIRTKNHVSALSAVTAVSSSRKTVMAATVLAVVAFGAYVLIQFTGNPAPRVVSTAFFALFFLLITVVIIRHILSVPKVTSDTIFGAICAYLVLGMVWTMVYSLLEILAPGSFLHGGESVAIAFNGTGEPAISNFIYYSFVTLTTLGYGDITPGTSPAAALSSLEAVTGQLYLAILIARFVGLNIAAAGKRKEG